MKKFIATHKLFVILTSVLLTLIVLMIVVISLQNNTSVAESWTRGFGRVYLNFFGHMYEFIGFSVFETMVATIIISVVILLAWAFSLFGFKNIFGGINRLLIIAIAIVSVVTLYNASVGMAYKRSKMPMEQYTGEIKEEEFKDLATYFVNDYNKCVSELGIDEHGELKMPYSTHQLIENLRKEYAKLTDDYYNPYTPTAKPLFSSGLFTTVSVVGVYFGPTAEANYSTYSTNIELPFYIAHEMAHGKGVMREDDAQNIATYICLHSEDPLIRLSGYYCTNHCVTTTTKNEGLFTNQNDANDIWNVYSPEAKKNRTYIYNHWKGKTFLSDFGEKVNDWYLKTFEQPGGVSSYSGTPSQTNEQGRVIKLSSFQNIYFIIYYNR